MAEFLAISKGGAIMSSAIGKSHAEKRERRETLEKAKTIGPTCPGWCDIRHY
jgi:hypothetical protein